MLEKLAHLREEVLEKLDKVGNLEELNELRVKILGKKGEFTAIMRKWEISLLRKELSLEKLRMK